MNKQIEPFNPWDGNIVALTNEIIDKKPVSNLTVDEVLTTLRLIQLQVCLGVTDYYHVDVRRNDDRLKDCSDTDRFLALLIERSQNDYLLTSRNLIERFGGTKYKWRKIGRTCPITETVSGISECSSGYYGRGWIIAPHIETLRTWIIDNTEFAKELKG